jgi:hypothetical protein
MFEYVVEEMKDLKDAAISVYKEQYSNVDIEDYDVDLGEPMRVMDEVEKQKATEQGFSISADKRFQLLEMHVDLNLPGYEDVDDKNHETGIALPYVVTIERGTQTILAISSGKGSHIEPDLNPASI